MRLIVATSLLLTLVAACGGESRRNGGDGSDDGENGGFSANTSGGFATGGFATGGSTTGGSASGATGGALTGGSSSTGGTANVTGGASGSAGIDDCSNLPPSGTIGPCVPNCATDPDAFISAECVGGAYVCPRDSLPIRSCPPESCARRNDFECCRLANGTVEPLRCSADGGGSLPCQPGTEQQERGTSCVPDGVDATMCVDLQGRRCEDESLQCHQGKGCGDTTCACEPGPENIDLFWQCRTVLCGP